jgi:hypothetical protein
MRWPVRLSIVESYKGIRTGRIVKLSSMGAILLLLFAGSSLGLVWVHAAGPAVRFGPTLLSGTATTAKEPAISTSSDGTYVYVAWTQGGGGIYFVLSSNGGSSFSKAAKISTSKGTTQFPVMITGDGYQSPNSGDVYVAWAQSISGTLQIFVASSTTNGGTWSVAQVSSGGGITPALAASGSDVYVTWYQTSACPVTALNPSGQGCIYVDSSTNNGASGSWTSPVELNPSSKGEAQVVTSGSYVYVTADGTYFSSYGLGGTWKGGGTTSTGWTTPLQVYGFYTIGSTTSFGREPWIAASGLDVYITFNAIDLSTTSTYRIYGLTSNDGGMTWYSGTSTSASHKVTSFPPVFTTAAQQKLFLMSGSVSNDWEPENVASGTSGFMTFHSLANQGIYMTSTTNGGGSWSTPVQVPSQARGTSAYAHIFSSDGTNVWVMWGQVKSGSVWNAYVSYSANSGGSWSAPLDISNNAAGVAAGNQDVTLFWVSSIGTTCFAAWTYTSGSTSEVMFASITG